VKKGLIGLLMVVAAAVLLAACGGDDETSPLTGASAPTVPTEVPSIASGDDLLVIANEAFTFIELRFAAFSEVSSTGELATQLNEAGARAAQLADRAEGTTVASDLEDERDNLADALRNVGDELADVSEHVAEDDDLSRSLTALDDVESLPELEDAIADVRAAAGS
jgi:hypothetical protein